MDSTLGISIRTDPRSPPTLSLISPHRSPHLLQGLRRRVFQISNRLSGYIPICDEAYYSPTEAETRRIFLPLSRWSAEFHLSPGRLHAELTRQGWSQVGHLTPYHRHQHPDILNVILRNGQVVPI